MAGYSILGFYPLEVMTAT